MDSAVNDYAFLGKVSKQQGNTSTSTTTSILSKKTLRLMTSLLALIPGPTLILLLVVNEVLGTVVLFDPKNPLIIIAMNIIFVFHLWTRKKLDMVGGSNLFYTICASALFWLLSLGHIVIVWLNELAEKLVN